MLIRNALSAVIAPAVIFAFMMTGCDVGAEDDQPTLDEIEGPHALEPTIWVHGCAPPVATQEQISHFTDPQRQFFASKGYPASFMYRFVFSGAQCGSNIDFANEISDLVDQALAETGADRVNIVAHSMGALATRLYLYQGGNKKVRRFISLAGANHGGNGAAVAVQLQAAFGYPAYEGGKELYPPYACAGQTSGGAADIQATVNGCLTATGRTAYVDETPEGGASFLSIRNTLDEEVVPVGSACLNQRFQNDCADRVNVAVTVPPGPGPCGPEGCPGHVTMLWDPGVMQRVYDQVVLDTK